MKRLTIAIAVLSLSGCMLGGDYRPEPKVEEPKVNWPKPQLNGSIFQQGRSMLVFENRTAKHVGDILTVILKEKTTASKSASSSSSKDTSLDVTAGTILGKLQLGDGLRTDVSGSKSFDGEGSADQSNNLTGEISCMVTDVLPNGNLLIAGKKKIVLNRGNEYITISGIVRPDDIDGDNKIMSTRIANVDIAYTGSGEVADASVMGWLSKFFFSPLWPF